MANKSMAGTTAACGAGADCQWVRRARSGRRAPTPRQPVSRPRPTRPGGR